ncbi:hypothetical protein K431DRAFT_319779 [Polychaeton citri CBS 116435]|uniref:HEAT repeat protein n=1 Tax=Polychaeton citri CBS 116435 TaxID=1314669 RepID=A0A9P4QA36_9PEZI|nr:hypothetical protein K431DRAFT_319779 [Polychaeton citri CBS 116435]
MSRIEELYSELTFFSSKGKAGKPPKVVKPQKARKSTKSSRNHRFQPFSERIATLKIDPVRRRTNGERSEELENETATYFGRSLEEWKDINLSHTFATFAKEVSPLCDSLPVVLHNQDEIMELLVKYIEKMDALAMEPLLNLLSHFAHDLDSRFHKHFQRSVVTVSAVAAQHEDPAVIEWSFTCLAWLFKYLSRLLTPDLCPLYDLMSPYLGKTKQKPFVIRFAAESLSFLIRKAATSYERDEESLNRIVGHVIQEWETAQSSASSDLYAQGIMTLFTEAIKGVQNGLHSSGLNVFKSLLEHAARVSKASSRLVVGTLTSLIHHSTPHTFEPVAEFIISWTNSTLDTSSSDAFSHIADPLLTMVSVRKGTRVADWRPVMKTLSSVVEKGLASAQEMQDVTKSTLLTTCAVALQTASLEAVVTNRKIFDLLQKGVWSSQFLKFCDLFSRLGRERFDQFLMVPCLEYIAANWNLVGNDGLLYLQALKSRTSKSDLVCPSSLQTNMLEDLRNIRQISGSGELAIAKANSALNATQHLNLTADHQGELEEELSALIGLFKTQEVSNNTLRDFAFGKGLHRLVQYPRSALLNKDTAPLLCTQSSHLLQLPVFWQNLRDFLKRYETLEVDLQLEAQLQQNLTACLANPSHEVRECALEILQNLYEKKDEKIPLVLVTAFQVETTPINIETARAISMNIRRMTSSYINDDLDDLMRKAIPTYCFGLLHLKLAQAWEDACQAISEICNNPVGEDIVVRLAEEWLRGVAPSKDQVAPDVPLVLDHTSNDFRVFSDFDCSNLNKMRSISQQVFDENNSGYPSIEEQLRLDHARAPMLTATIRGQALKALGKIPLVAEKHNRMLVPVLLRWAGDDEALEACDDQRWTRKDQKDLLSVFAKFVNPRVLYKSDEVYDALLHLCANGDVEIQRSALTAIYSWKNQSINRYSEHLSNLLDEARFREELSVFLQNDDDEEAIRPDDRTDLMPVLLRLLYGRAVAGGKNVQSSRRRAIFVALSRFGSDALRQYIEISTSSALETHILRDTQVDGDSTSQFSMPLRQQLGMLNMVHDMIETLGPDLESFATTITEAVTVCTVKASRQLVLGQASGGVGDESLLRSVRQNGVQCLQQIFANLNGSNLQDYATLLVSELVTPRASFFAQENAQSTSAMLRLLAAWSADPKTSVFLVSSESQIIPQLASLLASSISKDEVKLFVLREIFDFLLSEGHDPTLVQPYIFDLVQSISAVLRANPSRDILAACVATISLVASRITQLDQAQELVQVCTILLRKPSRAVSPKTKVGLLRTLISLLDSTDAVADEELWITISTLFSRLHDAESRKLLSAVLVKLCKGNEAWRQSALICEDLNSLAQMNEPDHVKRESGFLQIYQRSVDFSTQQWQPIMYNCLFYINDAEDLVNRSSAAKALDCFIGSAPNNDNLVPLTSDILLPGLERGMRESSELVRAEHLRLLHRLIETLPTWSVVRDMKCLTVDGDEEASFFINVLHIQHHRRLRALRRLAEDAPTLSPTNINRFLIPLLEHFIFDQAEGDAGRTLSDQTIETLGACARSLNWSTFKVTMRRYLDATKDEKFEKAMFRLVGVFADALQAVVMGSSETTCALKRSFPDADIFTRQILDGFLPRLTEYLHYRDESTVDKRIPVALTVVKLLRALPDENDFATRLAPALTDLCHVLRSRAIEARDQTRKALTSIVSLVGPTYFGYVLKELRSSLQRGYQLHVLSFTVHSLLVNCADAFKPGDLDEVLPELVTVVMDDTFGVTSQEKEAEEYKTSMKEIKSNKSFDTLELVARLASISHVISLIGPIQDLLLEKLDSRAVKKVDDLLTRIRKGLDQNPTANDRAILVLCHQVIRKARVEHQRPVEDDGRRAERNRYLVVREKRVGSRAAPTASHSFKLVSFALNLVRKIVKRHEELMTPANMAGFLPIAGDSLVEGHEEVKIAAMRFLTVILRVPLKELDANAPVYAREAVATIRGSTSTTTDSAKAALELLTAVLRDRRDANIRDRDLAQVLKTLKNDIDEPDRQGVVYKFLRSVIGRKVDAPEVYEVMDEVGKAMVTNPDNQVRESARGAYLQFTLDFPQGKKRWQKQVNFLVQNLDYEHRSGRQTVMEMLYQLLKTLGDDVLQPLVLPLFVPLVLRIVNDDDPECREMSSVLTGKLFERADKDGTKQMLGAMRKWLSDEKDVTTLAALQAWAIHIGQGLTTAKDVSDVLAALQSIIQDRLGDDQQPDQIYVVASALRTLVKACETCPNQAFSSATKGLWSVVERCQSASDFAVKKTAATLVNKLGDDIASSNSKAGGLGSLPLKSSAGLPVTAEDLQRMTAFGLRSLKNPNNVDENFLTAIVRNLVFVARCYAANNMTWTSTRKAAAEAESDSSSDEAEEASTEAQVTAFAYLLKRLSYLARNESLPAQSRSAALKCQAIMIQLSSPSSTSLQQIMQPLYVLTDSSIPQQPGEQYTALTEEAREVLELLQKKLGSEAYVAALNAARKAVQGRRDERRQKRRIDAVAAPERWAKEKKRKYEVKKARQKARGVEARGQRRGW